MAVTHKQLIAPQKIGAGVSTLYTVGENTVTQIRAFSVSNTTDNNAVLNVYLGGTADNHLVEKKTIASSETYLCLHAINQILKAGDKISVSGDGLSVMVSGAEIT